MNEPLVKVENVSKRFCRSLKRSLYYGLRDIGTELTAGRRKNVKLRKGEFWALDHVDFEVAKGELVGLIGPNGAGKTTILKLLTGLIKPDTGKITVRGKVQALIALGAGFNPILTGRENVYINGAILGFSKKDIDQMLDDIIRFSEVGEFMDMPVQSYSSGMRVRLGFAVAVNLKPDILIVDEVLAVGDASFRRKARNKMTDLLHSGISVLFVSHNMATVNALTSRCIYLNKGKVVSIGPSDEVTSHYLRDSINRARRQQNGDNARSGSQGNGESSNQTGDSTADTSLSYMESAYLSLPDVFVLKNVVILSAEGEPIDEFHTFDSIGVSFQVEFKEPVTNMSFAMGVRTQIDDLVVGFTRIVPKEQKEYMGQFTVECRMDRNRFREGVYNIGFYVAGADGGSYFKSNCVKSFTILADMNLIEASGSSQGLMVLDSSWSLEMEPGATIRCSHDTRRLSAGSKNSD